MLAKTTTVNASHTTEEDVKTLQELIEAAHWEGLPITVVIGGKR